MRRFRPWLRPLLCGCVAAAVHGPAPALTPSPAPVIEEVPFITTPDHVTVALLELAGVGPRDHVIDLGSGDGRIAITAAQRFGARGLGVEIVPELVARSIANARLAGVSERASFRTQDLFDTDLAPATVVTRYLLPEVNLALRPRLLALAPGTRIVSHDWDLGDWRPDRTLTLAVPEKTIGLEKLSRLHLWTVPARVDGLWCGAAGAALRVVQRYQEITLTWTQGAEQQAYSGRIDGRSVHVVGAAGSSWTADVGPEGMRITQTSPGLPALAGQRLQPGAAATRSGCDRPPA